MEVAIGEEFSSLPVSCPIPLGCISSGFRCLCLCVQPLSCTSATSYHATETAQKDKPVIAMQLIAVPVVPLDELKDITDNFSASSLIGEGSYGRVYHGVIKNGKVAAVKKLDSSKQPDQEFLAQVSMVSRLKNDNVVELLGYCVDGGLRVLIYECAPNGSLHDILHEVTVQTNENLVVLSVDSKPSPTATKEDVTSADNAAKESEDSLSTVDSTSVEDTSGKC